jgi:hypothetical protein
MYMTGSDNYWGQVKTIGNWWDVPHFLLGTTYMVMSSHRDNVLEQIKTKGWHSPDIWLARTFGGKVKMLVSNEPIVYQKQGYSVLDYLEKW